MSDERKPRGKVLIVTLGLWAILLIGIPSVVIADNLLGPDSSEPTEDAAPKKDFYKAGYAFADGVIEVDRADPVAAGDCATRTNILELNGPDTSLFMAGCRSRVSEGLAPN